MSGPMRQNVHTLPVADDREEVAGEAQELEAPGPREFFAPEPPCRYEVRVFRDRAWHYVKSMGYPADESTFREAVSKKLGPGRYRVKVDRLEHQQRVATWSKMIHVPGVPRPAPEAMAAAQAPAALNVPAIVQAVAQQVAAHFAERLDRIERAIAVPPQPAASIGDQLLMQILPGLLQRQAAPPVETRGLQPLLEREYLRGVERGRLEEQAGRGGEDDPVPAPEFNLPTLIGTVAKHVADRVMGANVVPVGPVPGNMLGDLAAAIQGAAAAGPAVPQQQQQQTGPDLGGSGFEYED